MSVDRAKIVVTTGHVAPAHEMVHHPRHYNAHPSGLEAIDLIEHLSFNVGTAIKYLWRASLKYNAKEDVDKALWYLDREVVKLSKQWHAVERLRLSRPDPTCLVRLAYEHAWEVETLRYRHAVECANKVMEVEPSTAALQRLNDVLEVLFDPRYEHVIHRVDDAADVLHKIRKDMDSAPTEVTP